MLLFLAMIWLSICLVNGLRYHGADISSMLLVEADGVKFTDTNGQQNGLEDILRNNGMNAARVRLWTSGTYNTTYGLAMGKVMYSFIIFSIYTNARHRGLKMRASHSS